MSPFYSAAGDWLHRTQAVVRLAFLIVRAVNRLLLGEAWLRHDKPGSRGSLDLREATRISHN